MPAAVELRAGEDNTHYEAYELRIKELEELKAKALEEEDFILANTYKIQIQEATAEPAAAAGELGSFDIQKTGPWNFVHGCDPGSDPFSDKKAGTTDPEKMKQECRDLNGLAVTTNGRIKFALPPRNQWIPIQYVDESSDFGTWVWKGNDEAKMDQAPIGRPGGVPVPQCPY